MEGRFETQQFATKVISHYYFCDAAFLNPNYSKIANSLDYGRSEHNRGMFGIFSICFAFIRKYIVNSHIKKLPGILTLQKAHIISGELFESHFQRSPIASVYRLYGEINVCIQVTLCFDQVYWPSNIILCFRCRRHYSVPCI